MYTDLQKYLDASKLLGFFDILVFKNSFMETEYYFINKRILKFSKNYLAQA